MASVERRAYRMAVTSVQNRADALDIVQDTMMKLLTSYGSREAHEWRPLFFRILHNRITDLHRKRKIQSKLMGWLGNIAGKDTDYPQHDVIANTAAPEHCSPHYRHEQHDKLETVQNILTALPLRQQQAFMLRCWEGLSTRETSTAMNCSESSVKTHYSRAIHALRIALGGNHDE